MRITVQSTFSGTATNVTVTDAVNNAEDLSSRWHRHRPDDKRWRPVRRRGGSRDRDGIGASTLKGGSGNNLLIQLGNNGTVVGGSGNNQILLAGTNEQVAATNSIIDTAARSSVSLSGKNDTVQLGGTGDSLAAYGGGYTITAGAGDSVVLGSTNGTADTVDANGDQLGGTTANGQGTGISLNSNAQANVYGSSDGITLNAGDSLAAFGGGNTILSGAGDYVLVSNTNGSADTVDANGDQLGGKTSNGQGTGIALASNAQANVYGSGDGIALGTGDSLAASGGGNTITMASNANDSLLVSNTNGVSDIVGATGDSIRLASNAQANVYGSGDGIALGTGDSLAASGGGNTINSGSGDWVWVTNTNGTADTVDATGDQYSNPTATSPGTGIGLDNNAQAIVNGNGDGIALGTGDSLAASGESNTIYSGAGDWVWVANTNGDADTVVATNDQYNNPTATSPGTGIGLANNAQASVYGNDNGIALGTGDSLAASGESNTIYSGAGDLVWVANTNGDADTVDANGDQYSNPTATSPGTGIGLASNAQAVVNGSGDGIALGTGDSLAASGGGNTIYSGAGDLVWVANTNGNADTVDANGDQYSNPTATSAGTGIGLANNAQANVYGSSDGIALGTGDSLGAYGGGNTISSGARDAVQVGNTNGNADTVDATDDQAGSTTANGLGTGISLNSNAQANVDGNSDSINLASGDSVTIVGSYDTANSGSGGDTVGFDGTNETANLSSSTVNLDGDNQNVTINGSLDVANSIWSGDTVAFNGSNEAANLSGGTVDLEGNNQSVNVTGNEDVVSSSFSGDSIGFAGSSDTAQINNGMVMLNNSSTSVTVEGSGDLASSQYSGNTIGFTGTNDTALVKNGTIYTDTTSGASLTILGAEDATDAISGTTQSAPVLDDQTLENIYSIYNAVLGRDPSSAELIGAQTELATGVGLGGLSFSLATSSEAQYDMASTFAAATAPYQTLMNAQPVSNVSNEEVTDTSTMGELIAFADAMSTSYGAPIEVFSVDPYTGQQTELADTSITNLLAELPVLETEANGVNLGLQLADGMQLQFSSTAGLATFLYSLGVQQGQATQFVTANYNLDMQWLNSVDQPLLQEAVFWSERATAEASVYPERTIEDNVQASLALQIAGESPSSRQDIEQTINNAQTGNPTQITVYAAADGSKVHDVSGSIFGLIESALGAILNVAAVFFPESGLPFLAAALDTAEAGQAFSNGEDVQGILSLAQALGMGASGLGYTQTAQIVAAATQGVGGVYGIVQSAQNGNAAGILAGALEAAAASATGIGIYEGGQTQQTLNALAAALGTAGVATAVANDFASGNVGQGLVDSLNLYLPAVAQAYINSQANQSNLQTSLEIVPATLEAASAEDDGISTDYSSAIEEAFEVAALPQSNSGQATAPTQYAFKIDTTAFAAAVTNAGTSGVPSFNSSISQANPAAAPPAGSTSETVPINGVTWQLTFSPATSTANGSDSVIDVTAVEVGTAPAATDAGQSALDTIQATVAGIANDAMSFLSYLDPIGTAEAADNGGPTHPVVIPNPTQYESPTPILSPLDGLAECVALIQYLVPSIGQTKYWVEGALVTPDTPIGTVVATFDPISQQYINSKATSHVGIFDGFDSAGNMILIDQWDGSGGINAHTYRSNSSTYIGNPANYHVVMVH